MNYMSKLSIYLFILWQFACLQLHAQLNDSTHVVINPDGHMAPIKAMEFSPDGKLLYSVSDDKTVRVWDIERGELVQTFRGYIERGNIGMFNSAALTPDGQFLAVGGFLGSKSSDPGDIRYLDAETGDVIYVFKGHRSTVVSLTISEDGNYMASGSSDGIIGIWSLKNGQGVRVRGHRDGVYGLSFSPSGNQLVSASYDSAVRIWDMSSLLEEGKFDFQTLSSHLSEVRSVKYAPNGEFFVSVGYDKKIIQYDSLGNFIKVIAEIDDNSGYAMVGAIHTVSISSNSKTLVVGTYSLDNNNALVFDIESGEQIASFNKHNNTVIASAFYGNSMVATAGGNNRDIYVWNPETGKEIAHFAGKGERIWKIAAGPDGLLGIGTETKKIRKVNDHGQLNKLFDLDKMKYIGEHQNFDGFTSERTDTLDYTLTQISPYKIAISSVDGNSFIELDPGVEGMINSFSLTPDQNIVVGSNFRLGLYSTEGILLKRFEGHLNDVYTIAFSDNGKYMYTGSGDQTVRIWDLSDDGKYERTFDQYMNDLREYYGDSSINELESSRGTAFFNQLYKQNEVLKVYPKANIFLTSDDNWIIWTDEYYYASSKGASQFVGFQQSLGEDTLAKFYSFEQFDVQLNRPDKVLQVLGTGDQEVIEMYEQAYTNRLKKLGLTESSFSSNLQAPELKVKTKNQTVYKSRFGFSNLIMDTSYGLDAEFVTINGVPVYGTDGLKIGAIGGGSENQTVVMDIMHASLVPGRNKVEVWCTNKAGIQSNRETRYIYFDTAEVKPDLYILGIGASKYSDDDFDLKYAAKDVRDFIALQKTNAVYANIHIDTLMNQEVTIENIKASLSKLNKAKVYDHVVIYYAGHGLLTEELDYYLATYNTKFNKPEKEGLDYYYFENEIGKLHARTRTVYIDACHSGEVDKENTRVVKSTDNGKVTAHESRGIVVSSTGLENDALIELINDMYSDLRVNSGATIIASAGGAEYAYEGAEWNNGVFTYAVLHGIRSRKADLDNNGEIMLSELQNYVRSEVVELTQGLQQPTNRFNNVYNDHVVWKY